MKTNKITFLFFGCTENLNKTFNESILSNICVCYRFDDLYERFLVSKHTKDELLKSNFDEDESSAIEEETLKNIKDGEGIQLKSPTIIAKNDVLKYFQDYENKSIFILGYDPNIIKIALSLEKLLKNKNVPIVIIRNSTIFKYTEEEVQNELAKGHIIISSFKPNPQELEILVEHKLINKNLANLTDDTTLLDNAIKELCTQKKITINGFNEEETKQLKDNNIIIYDI
jgi:hypothetical protein